MKLSLMRKLDYYLGIPTCFFLTIIDRIRLFFFKRSELPVLNLKSPKVLYIKLSEMGTTILLIPVNQKVDSMFPAAEKYFLVFHENKFIINYLNIVPSENILSVRTNSILYFVFDLIKHIIFLRRQKIDIAIDFEFFARSTAIITYLASARRSAGFHRFHWEGLYRGDLFTHKVNFNPFYHTVHNFLSLVYSIKRKPGFIVIKEKPESLDSFTLPQIHSRDNEKAELYNKLKSINKSMDNNSKIIIFNPDTSRLLPYRKWPLNYFTELGKKITSYDSRFFIAITGSSHSVKIGRHLEDSIKTNVINLVGKTTIKELFTLYNIADILISVDSGPVHFASLTDIHIICIFGPDTPLAFASLNKKCTNLTCDFFCQPCYSVFNNRVANCEDKEKDCMKAIAPDKVFEVFLKLI